MKSPLAGFVETARAAGIRISVAETLDAFRAVETVGYADRDAFKDALAVALAKSREEKELFDRCFELYFRRDAFPEQPPAPVLGDAEPDASDAELTRLLRENDRTGLALAMERAGNRVGVGAIRYWTQANMYARRLLDELGIADLDRDVLRLRIEAPDAVKRLEQAREALRERVRRFVEQRLALTSTRPWDDAALSSISLWSIDRRDLDRMRALVRSMAKRLATRYGRDRRSRRRGRLDVRRTLRRNTAHDGIPFRTVWTRQKREKPRVVALCDVSGSVAPVAQFLLLFLYSLKDVLADVRAFAFSNRLVDVGEILDREPIDGAIATIMRDVGFGSSDYGRSLEDFARAWLARVDRHTSVIIMGDARTNYADPRTELMRALCDRSKRVIWLNPESRSSWGTGDSVMPRYQPYCHVARPCATLRDLERTMSDLLAAR